MDEWTLALCEHLLRAPDFLYDDNTRCRAQDVVNDLTGLPDTWDYDDGWDGDYCDDWDDARWEARWKAKWECDCFLDMVVPEHWWAMQEETERRLVV